MNSYYAVIRSPDYLEHFNIKGSHWGKRRYQNYDGSLTPEGRERYGVGAPREKKSEDSLSKKEMKKMIRDYNTRTGEKKKINKYTTFKTDHGTYDYKGRRMDVTTDVNDQGKTRNPKDKKNSKNTAQRTLKDMSVQEIKDMNARMDAELDYIRKYNQLHPQQVSIAQQVMTNLRNDLIRDIPQALSTGIKDYISKSISNAADQGKSGDKKKSENSDSKPKKKVEDSKPAEKVKDVADAVKETKKAVKEIADDYKADKAAKAAREASAPKANNSASKVPTTRSSDSYKSFKSFVNFNDAVSSITTNPKRADNLSGVNFNSEKALSTVVSALSDDYLKDISWSSSNNYRRK